MFGNTNLLSKYSVNYITVLHWLHLFKVFDIFVLSTENRNDIKSKGEETSDQKRGN